MRTKIGLMTDVSQAYPWQEFEIRKRHLYALGATSTGKSTLLLNLIRQECEHGVIVLDPDGCFADEAAYIIDKAGHNLTYVSEDNPMVINPLDKDMPWGKLANEFIEAMNAVVKATSSSPDSTVLMGEIILEAVRFLRPKSIEEMAKFLNFKKIRDTYPGIKTDDYWGYFDALNEKGWPENREKVESSKRIGARLTRMWRNPESAKFTIGANQFDPKYIADNKQKVIFNLGALDTTTIIYIGNIIFHAVKSYYKYQATKKSPRLYIYADEFHLFSPVNLGTILTQSRKYNISINLAHQIHRQIEPDLLHAIMGSCSTMAIFDCGPQERKTSADFIGVRPSDFGQLAKHHFYYWTGGATQVLRGYNIKTGEYTIKSDPVINPTVSVLDDPPIIEPELAEIFEKQKQNYYREGWIVL